MEVHRRVATRARALYEAPIRVSAPPPVPLWVYRLIAAIGDMRAGCCRHAAAQIRGISLRPKGSR